MKYYPINSLIFGKGESYVLFLHGWGGSTNSFFNVAEKLSKNKKIILVDLYGFGESKYPEIVLDIYEYALQIYLMLKRKKITSLSIVAHSFGGRIAMLLASMFDLNIENLVLIDSAGIRPKHGIVYRLKVLRYKIAKIRALKKGKSKTKLSKYGSDEYKKLNEVQKAGYVKIVNQDLTFVLKNIRSKTLLVWGSKDKSTPMYMAKIIQKNIQGSRLYVYLDSGHFCYLENYLNFVNLLKVFLKSWFILFYYLF